MSHILDTIVARKREEVQASRSQTSLSELRDMPGYQQPTVSVVDRIKRGMQPAVITEFKRRSPSKGWIHEAADVTQVAPGYCAHGAAAISVLTDVSFFGGSLVHLQQASQLVDCPLLRKDFTIDAWQLHEARAYGADVILLIAAILSPAQVQELAEEAKSLGLEVLLELHDEAELGHVCAAADLIGINNRNLKNFEVNLEHSIRMAAALPADKLRIAESGIGSAADALFLSRHGFDGFLIGEYFMKQIRPSEAFSGFIQEYKQLQTTV